MSRLAEESAREVMVKQCGQELPVLQNKPVKLQANLYRAMTLSLSHPCNPGLQRARLCRSDTSLFYFLSFRVRSYAIKFILFLYSSFSKAPVSLAQKHCFSPKAKGEGYLFDWFPAWLHSGHELRAPVPMGK